MLRELQGEWLAALLASGPAPDAEGRVRPGAMTARERLEVYRHNVMSNLTGALADIYPVTQRIVGEDFFAHAADAHCRATPSRSGDLNDFGAEWPAFIAAWPHAQDLPYLADVGRLEWAWHRAFHAADAEPLDLARVAAIPAERQPAMKFRLHPAVSVLASRYPLWPIWRVNQDGYEGDQRIDWDTPVAPVMVRREGYAVVVEPITQAELRFLSALTGGAPFESAAEAAFAVDGEFDLQGFLVRAVQSGVIVDVDEETQGR